MAGTKTFRPMLLDEFASLGSGERREVATTLRQVAETFAEVPDGKTASYVLGVIANLVLPT